MSGPIPDRVAAAVKSRLLELVGDAIDAGWSSARACAMMGLDRRRWWRWRSRAAEGRLEDTAPGGNPVHGLLASEEDEIVALFDEWGPVDLSHRKLAHRGSYLGRLWVSPSTFDRVLTRRGPALPARKRSAPSHKAPWPDVVEWRPNQLWCWDGSQFERCIAARYAYAIIDLVSRKWIAGRALVQRAH